MVHEWEFEIRGESYILLGMQSDGKWVKYFDTRDIKKKYFREATARKDIPCFVRGQSKGDTISVVYQRVNSNTKRLADEGEFRFKWDDGAQWFGIEQVVY